MVNGLCHGLTDGNGLGGAMERESAGDETCPCGGGRTWEERSLLAVRLVPCGGGRTWEERSLLAGRPVHAGEGECGERGVCWR